MPDALSLQFLRPYLVQVPESSLILLTSVLNASTNWLLLHLVTTTLADVSKQPEDKSSSVVFLSFLRSWEFWREGARRMGCDLLKSSRDGRFVFLDGLTNVALLSEGLLALEEKVLQSIAETKSRSRSDKVVLILDGLDFFLAARANESTEQMLDVLASWREETHSVVVAASADSPLIHSPSTPLETSHAAFVISIAHQASTVISLRLLSTGVAKDVSGVIRLTRGPNAGEDQEIAEKELLYLVNSDGSVRVFERGS